MYSNHSHVQPENWNAQLVHGLQCLSITGGFTPAPLYLLTKLHAPANHCLRQCGASLAKQAVAHRFVRARVVNSGSFNYINYGNRSRPNSTHLPSSPLAFPKTCCRAGRTQSGHFTTSTNGFTSAEFCHQWQTHQSFIITKSSRENWHPPRTLRRA